MTTYLPQPDLFALLLLGLAIPVFGLLGLVACPTWWRRAALIGSPAVAALAAAAALAGASPSLWLAPALLAGFCGASAALRSGWAAPAAALLFALVRRPALHAAALLVAGPAVASAWIWWSFPVIPPWELPAGLVLAHESVPLRADRSWRAATDAGRVLPLYHPAEASPSTEQFREMDAAVIAAQEAEASVIRTAPPSQDYNCHGWVFAEGRFWVQGEAVEHILRDNGYQTVRSPQAGDLVVYRDDAGHIVHSGVVRFAAGDGLVLVESKWGTGGRFLSAPDKVPYGNPAYYRSGRTGRQLRLITGEDAPPQAPIGQGA